MRPREKPERPADPAVRRANLRRVRILFSPYRLRLGAVLALIFVSALLGMVSPFLVRDIFDDGAPGGRRPAADRARRRPDRDRGRHRRPRRRADLAVERRRPAGDARPARGRLPAPAAALARVLHAHAHRRGAVADRERHRRRRERRHLDGDVDRLERDHGGRGRRRDVPPRLAARGLLARARAGLRPASRAGSASSAGASPPRASGRWPTSRRSSRSRSRSPGSCSARRWAAAPSSPTASSGESARARRPRGAAADGRPLGDGLDPDDVRDHARARLLVRAARASSARDLARHPRRLHDAADAALLPDRLAALRADRRADLARALRPRLRVPRPAGRDRRARTTPSTSPPCRGDVAFEDVWFRYDGDGPLDARGRRASTVPAGTTTAIVGETGSGKTTLGYLVARLYDVERGARHDRRHRRPRRDASRRSRARSASSRRRPTSSTRRSARTCASPGPTRPTRRSRRRPAPRASTT